MEQFQTSIVPQKSRMNGNSEACLPSDIGPTDCKPSMSVTTQQNGQSPKEQVQNILQDVVDQ